MTIVLVYIKIKNSLGVLFFIKSRCADVDGAVTPPPPMISSPMYIYYYTLGLSNEIYLCSRPPEETLGVFSFSNGRGRNT